MEENRSLRFLADPVPEYHNDNNNPHRHLLVDYLTPVYFITTTMMDGTSKSHSSTSSVRSNEGPDLEELAEALEAALKKQGLGKKNTFSGKDAVTVLQNLLQAKADQIGSVSRKEALEKGNEIRTEFDFFRHVPTIADTVFAGDKPLVDKPSEQYYFECNLPSQVKKAKSQHKSYWDKAKLIEENVECKDRWHLLQVYENCFIAREAVDVIMNLKLVKNRKNAVKLMKKLNQQVFLCEHVTREHEFKDEHLFFEFIPQNQRMREPHQRAVDPETFDKKVKHQQQKQKQKQRMSTFTKKNNRSRLEEIKKRLSAIPTQMQEVILLPKEGGPSQRAPTQNAVYNMSWARVSLTNRAA